MGAVSWMQTMHGTEGRQVTPSGPERRDGATAWHSGSVRPCAIEHHVHGLEKNGNVRPQGPVLDVPRVEIHPGGVVDVIAATDLPQS